MVIESEVIKSQFQEAPTTSGVYSMRDVNKQIIYIGKAKNLKKRLANYLRGDLDTKTLKMIAATHHLEYYITNSEVEALLLEAQLIKKFQPKFNILLKDDKSFSFIKLRLDHDFPQLIEFRGKKLVDGEFFGPFTSTSQMYTTLKELQKIFKLRSCTDMYFSTRIRPCLQYEIKRCCAPCVGKISKSDYLELVQQVHDFLKGRTEELQSNLSHKMGILSEQMRFEEAAQIRDRIKALSYVQLKAGTTNIIRNADVIAIVGNNNHYCVMVFVYRDGQSFGGIPYFPIHTQDSTASEVLEHFLLQFYQKQQVPPEIIVNIPMKNREIITHGIKKMNNLNKFDIVSPSSGPKGELVHNVEANANLALSKYLKEFAKNQEIMKQIQDLFNLPDLPEKIEVYDNSHIMGKCAIGAMIVANRMGFDKKQYRIFTLNEASGDDFEMLRQVLTRRLSRLKNEPVKAPSLIIIDGGKGHLTVVKEVMNKLNIYIKFVCMSKGPDRNAGLEQFHMVDKESFTLDKNLPVMKYLQILRDEAHSFAIKSHRVAMSRTIKTSVLDGIPNIGATRKRALLHYFGSYNSIQDATVTELIKVKGISLALAQTIYETLRSK